MKFYSEVTKKMYDNAEACANAEHDYLKAIEEKQMAKESALGELASLKGEYESLQELAQQAVSESKQAYNALTKAVHAYYQKYGTVPEEYRDLNFFVSVFTRM